MTDGVVERRFRVGDIPGILWLPASASPTHPVPLILAGLPGGPLGLDRSYPRMFERARSAAHAGLATVTIESSGSGGRAMPDGVDDARRELRRALSAGEPIADDLVDRLVLPLVDQGVPEWQRTLDTLLELPEIGGGVGYSGGLISIGTRLSAVKPRISAAVLFAGSVVPRSILAAARGVTIPLYVLLQWDDDGNDRQKALDLFDAFGSTEKTLNANMGGHTGVPQHASDAATQFLVRHLKTTDRNDGG